MPLSKKYLLLLTYLLICVTSKAFPVVEEQDRMPVPIGIKDLLFYVQRTPNANTIVYQLNRENGVLNADHPVHIFWIRYTEDTSFKELSYIQRKFAYGLNVKKLGKDNYEMRFVSYDSIPLYLRKATDGNYYVYATINGALAALKRVYIKIDGGTFWSPNVIYIELKGTNVSTGAAVLERIKP